jgi:carboxyl-terminal processing protease
MRRPHWRAMLALLAILFSPVIGTPHIAGAAERAPAMAAEPHSSWTNVDIAKLYDAVVETIEKNFFDDVRLQEIAWRARADALRPAVLAASSAEDAIRQIKALLAELETSHTGLFTPDEYFYYFLLDIVPIYDSDLMKQRFWAGGPYYPGTGAFTRLIDGRHFVDGILEGSPADRAGLKYGDEILTVDGAPYSPIAAFRGKIDMTVELAIRRHADAQPQRLKVLVIPIRPGLAFAHATAASVRVIARDNVQIGYVHVWSSHDAKPMRAALSTLEPYWERTAKVVTERTRRRRAAFETTLPSEEEDLEQPLDFLIVDMRGRIGGNAGVAHQYLELLDARQRSYWGNSRAQGRSSERPATAMVSAARQSNPPFRGRSALLIDHNTRSAAEIMALGYQRSAFGPVIGTPTAGAGTSGGLFAMPGDLLLYVATSGVEFEGGLRLESVGVKPDHQVERPLPYAAGADPVLDAAVDILVKQAAAKRPD